MPDLDRIGLQFACVFSSCLDLECNICKVCWRGFMTNYVLYMFSRLFSMLVISFIFRSHFAHVFLSNSASASLEYSKNIFSLCFVDENRLAADSHLTRVFLCTVMILIFV